MMKEFIGRMANFKMQDDSRIFFITKIFGKKIIDMKSWCWLQVAIVFLQEEYSLPLFEEGYNECEWSIECNLENLINDFLS
eukprot:UN22552